MRYKFKYIHLLLPLFLLLAILDLKAQYPGGVSTGIIRGYKVDNYNGTFNDQTGFGAGTSNSIPIYTGYSNKITGTEFNNIRADFYGMEYTGILEIPTSGSYTFRLAGDDRIWLYIDNNLVVQANFSNGTQTATVNLTAGDHTIKVKHYELGGDNFASLQVSNGPAGSNITTATDLDGRFVRYEGAKLTAWYKASDLSVTPNFGGTGIDRVNSWTNKAPDYADVNGNLIYGGGSGYATRRNDISQVNFNPGVRFDGDDRFISDEKQKGISFRGATKSMFGVANYVSNTNQDAWLFYHGRTDSGANGKFGIYKGTNGAQAAVEGIGASTTSAWTANEPKLMGAFLSQNLGGTAPSGTNPLQMNINGTNGTPADIYSNVWAAPSQGIAMGHNFNFISTAHIPELIYYPFKLSATEEQKVNSYLAIKYGITLAQDYLNTSGGTIFGLTANVGYTNRIFGIGRELTVEGLNQKQSQSQMTSTTGYDFLVVSKGTIATTNDANTGALTDGDYLLLGDDNGSFSAQATEIPSSYLTSAGCAVNRIGREWKVQVTGNPGAIIVQAGSSANSFPVSATGITLLVDTDGDGNFTTGTVNAFPAASFINGIATFNNVTIPNEAVITFGWTVIAPGGVSTGLTLWSKADDNTLAAGNVSQWNDLSPNLNHLTRTANGNVNKLNNVFNYNPAVQFSGADNQFLQSNSALGMNGSNTYAEFYVLKSTGVSGLDFDEFITMGATNANHRWENAGTTFSTFKYAAFGNGTPQSTGAGTLLAQNLGLYSNTHSGTAAILRTNGSSVFTRTTTEALNLSGNFRIGTDVSASDGNWNSFQSPELIVYNTALNATDLAKVNSYLGIKYSIVLDSGNSNYISSNGTTIWTANTTYKNDIFGIGRDDCSGLEQKQSTAWATSTTNNLVMALGSLATSNQANNSNFAANNQFLIVANDGGALTSTTTGIPLSYTSCNAARYQRTWKAANTGSVTGVQMLFGNTTFPIKSNWSNLQLVIDSDGDGNYTTGTTTLLSASSVIGGIATFNNVTIPDGATFTLVFTVGYPGGVSKPTGITITAPVSGTTTNNVNGLTYNVYKTNTTAGTGISTGFGAYSPILLSTGYYSDATAFHSFPVQKIATDYGFADGYGVELTGKLFISSASANYQFRGVADDQLALIIDGNVVLNITSSSTSTSPNVNLTAGYHDIIIRGRELGGAQNFDLTWNNGSGSTFTAISDANFYTQAQGPSAWFEADDNILASLADGTLMTTSNNGDVWYDLSVNTNNITRSTSATAPLYYKTNNSFIRNYNPSINFQDSWVVTSNYLNGFAFGKQGKSVTGVASINNTAGQENLTGYGRDDLAQDFFRIIKTGGQFLSMEGTSNALTAGTAFYTSSTPKTNILQGIYRNGNIITSNNTAIYADNALNVQGTRVAWNTTMNDNGQMGVGNSPDSSFTNGWNGNVNEIMYYPWDLTAIERQKINSYLGIKWGVTLDQTTATDYLDSNGSVIWNAASGGIYKNDITGIGRDDCGALYQKQSTSTDGDDIVSLGLGSTGLVATNQDNTNTFSADKKFLLFAHNGVVITNKTQTNLPGSLSSCYSRLQREWQVQILGTGGTPGAVSIEIGKRGLLSINAATYKPVLLISNVAGDYTNATVVKYDKVANGRAHFNNVTLTNGQYFTLGYIEATPGGVNTNMTVWYNADYDAFTDTAQTTYAVNDGDKVASMNNIKFGATFSKVEQSNATFQPTYFKSAFNYNPGIYFVGNGQSSLNSTANVQTTDYRTTTTMTSVFAGYNLGKDSDPGPLNVFWWTGTNGSTSTDKTALERNQGFWGTSTSLPRTPTLSDPEIYSFLNTTSTGYRLLSNLKTVGSGSATNTGNINAPFYIGLNGSAGSGSTAGARFYLGEFVIYNDDKGAANSYDMKRIHSYLAIKYGFTLDNVSMGGSYIASDGAVIYNDANYWNRITGIGMDDCSGLDQKQSFSQVISGGALVKISNDTNGLAASNKENTAGFNVDKSFLVFGDNDKSLAWNATEDLKDPSLGTDLMRLNRVWRVKETGTVGTVFLQVPASTSSETTKLPAPVNSASDSFYLIVANSASGGVFSNPTVVPMIPNGTDWTVTYNFADGDYYTFGTLEACLAPAGITDGLTTWYKTTDLPLGAIALTTGTIADLSGSGNTLIRNASGAATAVAGTATLFNYNRYVALSGNAVLQKSALNQTAITAVNQGSLYAVGLGTNNASLFGLSRPSYNGPGVFATPTWANNAGTYGGAATADVANIWNAVKSTTSLFGSTNGTQNTTANATSVAVSSTYVLNIGSSYSGATQIFGNNTFSEAFSFNRELTTAEQQILNSYLAIKYGQTLSHNYFAPDYNGTNAVTTTLYDISTYGNRVFGVGNHIGGCFYQNQSTSSLTGSMLKISVDGVLNTENSQDKSKWTIDRSYMLMGDDNGALTWITTNKPYIVANNTCVSRITRQWKVATTNTVPTVLVTIPDSTSSATTKLNAIPANNDVYMIVSDQSDFTSVTASQQEIKMTLNTTSNEWEANVTFDPNTTRYITFIYRTETCGIPCVPVNPATSRIRLK